MNDPIFKRVSIRSYLDKPVEDEKIERILRAAMQAPSAMNQQAWEFYVVTNKEKIKELGNSTPFAKPCLKAPLVIVPMIKTDAKLLPFKEVDIAAATENILLEATSLGLGGVWMGIAPLRARIDIVNKILGNPSNLDAFALIAIGYPDHEIKQVSRYTESKVHYIK